MDYSTVIFRILKTIDTAFENGTKGSNIFDLDKIGISDKRLRIILKSLYDDGYIDGIAFINILGDEIPDFKLLGCYLTNAGMKYLNDNSTMKKVYAALKEAKEWIP